jgi:hypothetical protein
MTIRNAAFVGIRLLALYLFIHLVAGIPGWMLFFLGARGSQGISPAALWVSAVGPYVLELAAAVVLWGWAGKLADSLVGAERAEFSVSARDWSAAASILIGMFLVVRALPSILSAIALFFPQPQYRGGDVTDLLRLFDRDPVRNGLSTGLIAGVIMLAAGLVLVLAHKWVARQLTTARFAEPEEVETDG